MNQILKVSDKLLVWAIGEKMPHDRYEAIMALWKEQFGDTLGVQLAVFGETQIVPMEGGDGVLFSFNGDISPEFAEEFRKWWKEVTA